MRASEIDDETIQLVINEIIGGMCAEYEKALYWREYYRRQFYAHRLRSRWRLAQRDLMSMRHSGRLRALDDVPAYMKSEDAYVLGVRDNGRSLLAESRKRRARVQARTDIRAIMKSWSKSTQFRKLLEIGRVYEDGPLQDAAERDRKRLGIDHGLEIRWACESLVALPIHERLELLYELGVMKHG